MGVLTDRQVDALAPARLYWRDGRLWAELIPVAGLRFTDPFLVQSFERRMRQPFGQLCGVSVPIEELAELDSGLPPAGFIFHMSRCGSTLITQMLAALDDNLVLSEPEVLDVALECGGPRPIGDEERIVWLRALMASLGRRRRDSERRLFVKWVPWSVFGLSLLRRAFPEVPWIFVYRDPLEVMVSNLRQRAARMMPGMLDPRPLGLTLGEALSLGADEYLARLVAAICEAALAQADALRWVHYPELPAVVPSLFDLPDDARLDAVRRAHAKQPSQPFVADSDEKRRSATPELRALVDQWLRAPYERMLEISRRSQSLMRQSTIR